MIKLDNEYVYHSINIYKHHNLSKHYYGVGHITLAPNFKDCSQFITNNIMNPKDENINTKLK